MSYLKGKNIQKRSGLQWTEEDIQYLQTNIDKLSDIEIATYLQRSVRAIDKKARKLGLRVNKPRKNSDYLIRIKQALSNSDLTRAEIEDVTGIAFSSLYKPLQNLMDNNEVESYKRKDVEGLGRCKVVYFLIDKENQNSEVEI